MEAAPTLHEFLERYRDQIIARCQELIESVSDNNSDRRSDELSNDLPIYFDEVVEALRRAALKPGDVHGLDHSKVAPLHGQQRFRLGFRIGDVVHDYGAVCNAITDAAEQGRQPITVPEYRVLNQSLDAAMAQAVAAYTQQHDSQIDSKQLSHLGFIAHELRDSLASAILSAQLMTTGKVGMTGRTAEVLERSHRRLRGLIDKMLVDVRLESGNFHRQPIDVAKLLDEVEGACSFDAEARSITMSCHADPELTVQGDRQLLLSAVGNLVHNAIKFTHQGGRVQLRARSAPADRLIIEVEDECGGLPDRNANELFEPFAQRSEDRSGLGLGLTITRQAVQAHQGSVSVRNLEGKGCIFIIELPRNGTRTAAQAAQDATRPPS